MRSFTIQVGGHRSGVGGLRNVSQHRDRSVFPGDLAKPTFEKAPKTPPDHPRTRKNRPECSKTPAPTRFRVGELFAIAANR
jgi:hypothetical protein